VLPLKGKARSGQDVAGAGECLLVEAGEPLESDGGWMLIGSTA
jgi:hypothetical protein